jgi:hypothetical protein
VPEAPVAASRNPSPAKDTQLVFSGPLRARAPGKWPDARFTARPGDQLAPMRFLLAVAPDGRVLHVLKDIDVSGRMLGTDNKALDDEASQYLMKLWFQRAPDSQVQWGTATFHWGLDVKREEPR